MSTVVAIPASTPSPSHVAVTEGAADPEESFRSLVLLSGLEQILAEERDRAGEVRSLDRVVTELAANLPPGYACSREEVTQWLLARAQ